MDKDLVALLGNSGFSEKEANVYLALLELGKGTVSDIAKGTQLKRSIIYVILEGLEKRGYVSKLPDRKVHNFQAVDPSAILRTLQASTKNFSEMLPIMRTLGNKEKKKPKISYVDSKEGIWKIYEEMDYAKDCFFISSYLNVEKYFPDAIQGWMNYYGKNKNKLQRRHLIPDNPKEKEIGKKFEKINQIIRFLPGAGEFSMDFTIYDNKLAITSLEDELFAVVIESEQLIRSMKPIFEIAWKSGKNLDDNEDSTSLLPKQI